MRRDFALGSTVVVLLFVVPPARALDVTFDGFADFRLVAPAAERSWIDGGLGKSRYGQGDSDFQFGDAYGQATVLFTPEMVAVGVVRADDTQKDFVLPMEAYLRYRPVSTTPWRWS